jgi:molybdenum cofactor cytidylyltransferase
VSGVHALVLAAGAGRRFGGGKLMAPWRGGVLLDGALDAALAAPVDGVIVVSGADARVDAHVLGRADPRLTLVHAADHARGLSASLKAGLAALPGETVGALVFLGDMPLTPRAVLHPLVEALLRGASAAVPVHEGRRGHPAALSRRLFAAVAALDGDRGAGGLLDGLGDAVTTVETDDAGVLGDVDRPEDLAALDSA